MKNILTFTAAFLFITASARNASAQVWDCMIDFSDKFALNSFFDQNRTHFGIETRSNPMTGKLESCEDLKGDHGHDGHKPTFSKDDWKNCWAYRQRCSFTKFYVNAWPWGGSNHLHMFFHHPLLQNPFCLCDPGDGHGDGWGFSTGSKPKGKCFHDEDDVACPKWETFARNGIHPHTGGMWIYLFLEKGGDSQNHVFTLVDITIAEGRDAELWFVKPDGSSWGWRRLKPGYHKLNAKDAISVWISTADDDGPPIRITDFTIFPQEPSN